VGVIAKVTHALAPQIVVVENVPAFLTRVVRNPKAGTPISAAALLARSLRQRYYLTPLITDLADYGVPQTRRRAFLCFVRRGHAGAAALAEHARAPFPRPTHVPEYGGAHRTVRQALNELKAASLDAASADAAGKGMHAVPVWDAERYAMVAAIAKHSGAGAWQNADCLGCGEPASEDEASCAVCGTRLARPVVEDPPGKLRLVRGFRSSSYTRMAPDRPAATITTASGHMGSDRTLHPWENRVLSPLECAHLQTFPSHFDWGDALATWGSTNVRAMIGEAVPPGFTEIHGEVLTGLLTGKNRRPAISSSDHRVRRAAATLARAEAAARAGSDQ
jgi:DNA (cytosine-5)-methyltransferase 1